MDNIAMEILQRLDAVGEITKGAIEEIIPMAYQKVLISGYFNLFLGLILLIAACASGYILFKKVKVYIFPLNIQGTNPAIRFVSIAKNYYQTFLLSRFELLTIC